MPAGCAVGLAYFTTFLSGHYMPSKKHVSIRLAPAPGPRGESKTERLATLRRRVELMLEKRVRRLSAQELQTVRDLAIAGAIDDDLRERIERFAANLD
jgi:hypothetical protein